MFSKIKIGYCPTRRDVFSREEAQKCNRIIREALAEFPVEVVDLTGINEEELLKSAEKYGKSPYGKHLRNVADGKYLY